MLLISSLSKFDDAKKYLDESLTLAKQIEAFEEIALSYNSIGIVAIS